MKTPEEIKDGMEWCSGNACSDDCPYYHTAPECSANLCRDALAYIQQLEAQAPKWISVKEKMPEREAGLLLYADGHVYDGYLDYCGVCFEDEEGIIGDVTHWMLPPEPPEEEKDEEP